MEKPEILLSWERVLQGMGDEQMTVQDIRRAMRFGTRPDHYVRKLLEAGLIEQKGERKTRAFLCGGFRVQTKERLYQKIKNRQYVVVSVHGKKVLFEGTT